MAEILYMREYETVFLIRPDLEDAEVDKLAERIKGVIAASKGVIVKQENWGKRSLAYDIKGHGKAQYVFISFVGRGQITDEIERTYKMLEPIIKFMTVMSRDMIDPATVVAAPEAAVMSLPVTGPEAEFKPQYEALKKVGLGADDEEDFENEYDADKVPADEAKKQAEPETEE